MPLRQAIDVPSKQVQGARDQLKRHYVLTNMIDAGGYREV
jgi:hypothetical protein